MAEQNADLSAAFEKLLSDPEMLTRAMETAEKLKGSGLLDGLLSGMGEGKEKPSAGTPAFTAGAYRQADGAYSEESGRAAPESALVGVSRNPDETLSARQRRELLTAMRPFLGRERRERVDGILKILQLLELVQKLGAADALRDL